MKYILSISSILRKLSALSWILVILDINGGNFKVKKNHANLGISEKTLGLTKTLMYNNTQQHQQPAAAAAAAAAAPAIAIAFQFQFTAAANHNHHAHHMSCNSHPTSFHPREWRAISLFALLWHAPPWSFFLSHIYEHQYNGISKIPRP